MTYKKAKDIIECTAVENCDLCTTNVKNGGDCDCQKEFYTAINLAIEALEKQIPKKPKLNEDACGCRIDKTYSTDAHFCYNCNSYVPNYDYDKFCSACGQAIDWSYDE